MIRYALVTYLTPSSVSGIVIFRLASATCARDDDAQRPTRERKCMLLRCLSREDYLVFGFRLSLSAGRRGRRTESLNATSRDDLVQSTNILAIVMHLVVCLRGSLFLGGIPEILTPKYESLFRNVIYSISTEPWTL